MSIQEGNWELSFLSVLCTVIRASVPKLNLDDAFEQKNDIAKAVEDELEKAMSAYGFEIVQTLIIDIEPDEHVKRAMNEINAGNHVYCLIWFVVEQCTFECLII